MSQSWPVVYLVRHAETAWTRTGHHTGRTDLPLTEPGEAQARRLQLATASLSRQGYEHDLTEPVIQAWNETPQSDPNVGVWPATRHAQGWN
jgi:bisphosphoglycerate-dependent phosphoglycerate mutase